MRTLLRLGLGLALAVAAVLAALSLALPLIVGTDTMRGRIVGAVQTATRRPFSYGALEVGLFPPHVRLRDAVLAQRPPALLSAEGARPGAPSEPPPALQARFVEVRVAVLPLLAGAVVAHTLGIEGARVELVRTERGVRLAGEDLPEPPKAPRGAEAAQRAPDRGFAFGVERVLVRRSAFRLSDPKRKRARLLELRGVDANLRTEDGIFELDASRGESAWGGAIRKPKGTMASLDGKLVRGDGADSSALRLDGARLALGDLRATGSVELRPRFRVRLDAPPFEAGALADLSPPLAERHLSGRIALDGLEVETAPLAVRGRALLDGLAFGGGGREPLALGGALEATGDELHGQGLVLKLAGKENPVDLRVFGLGASAGFEVATKLAGVDASALVAALGGDRKLLTGPLDLDLRLHGPVSSGNRFVSGLDGDVALGIAPGTLRGVSLLRAAFARGTKLEPARNDGFDSLAGHLSIRGGVARSDDLRLVAQEQTIALAGRIGLSDGALDLHAELVEKGRVVPLGSVGGTLDDPKLVLTREGLAGAADAYTHDERRRGKWERKLDERLGAGEGKKVLEDLDRALDELSRPHEEPKQ